MDLSYKKLNESELATALGTLPKWVVADGMLTRLFEFTSYQLGLTFAMAVGWAADKLNHHPDMFVGYQKVRVSTTTHDSGGLTAYDVELAHRIDAL